MYQSPQALDKAQHVHLRYTPVAGYGFAAALTNVPLGAQEIVLASAHYPILFPQDGQPVLPIALLGLSDRNVFVDDRGQWTVDYVPAAVRRYPFVLGDASGGQSDTLLLAADLAAPHFQNTNGQALFGEDGQPTEIVANALGFLEAHQRSLLSTQAALAELDAKGVLVAKTLTIQNSDGQRLIGGFRVVEDAALNALDDATLAAWARNGLLQIVHAHWASLRHLSGVAIARDRRVEATQ